MRIGPLLLLLFPITSVVLVYMHIYLYSTQLSVHISDFPKWNMTPVLDQNLSSTTTAALYNHSVDHPTGEMFDRMRGELEPVETNLSHSRAVVEKQTQDFTQQKEKKKKKAEKKMVGQLNYDVWRGIVGFVVDDMRIKRDFPNKPDQRTVLKYLRVKFSEYCGKSNDKGKYGHKVYGFLLPPYTGNYTFAIELTKVKLAKASVELWLSTGADPMAMRRIIPSEYTQLTQSDSHVQSVNHWLEAGEAYYFEFLEKAFDGTVTAEVKWKPPGKPHFQSIPPEYFVMAVGLDENGQVVDSPLAQTLRGPLPSKELQDHHRMNFVGDTVYQVTPLDVLPHCDFQAEYAHVHKVQHYKGIKEVFFSKVYPPDDTWFGEKTDHKRLHGNEQVDPEVAENILNQYKTAFNESRHHGEVLKLHSLEETVNKHQGSRFLMELDIRMDGQDDVVHTSEYVYLPANTKQLCHTANFQWTPNTDVYLVVTVRNLAPWVKHLVGNLEYIYKQTQDEHFELLIMDFDSSDLDVEELLRKSSLKRWKVFHRGGNFSKTPALQAGIDYVTDPDSIVMTMDMHLALPTGFVEYTRRRTVRGKMGYAPTLVRLRRGYSEINVEGNWEIIGFGLFAMYKSDWNAVGGWDIQNYTTAWGGEDWDIVDRVLAKGYEIFRIRYPGLIHYYHTKSGMWFKKKS